MNDKIVAAMINTNTDNDKFPAFLPPPTVPYLGSEIVGRVLKRETDAFEQMIYDGSVRQAISATITEQTEQPMCFGDNRIQLLASSRQLVVDGIHKHVTITEFSIIEALAQNVGRVVTQNQLATKIWNLDGMHVPSLRPVIRIHMSNIREKLGTDDLGKTKGGAVTTIRGVGYKANDKL